MRGDRIKSLKLFRDHADIERNMQKTSDADRDLIVNYMEDEAFLLGMFVSPMIDTFDKKTEITAATYTDGKYLWNSQLVHWIRSYSVRVPDEFIAHVRSSIIPSEDKWAVRNVRHDNLMAAEPIFLE